jgi:hypothetical protein
VVKFEIFKGKLGGAYSNHSDLKRAIRSKETKTVAVLRAVLKKTFISCSTFIWFRGHTKECCYMVMLQLFRDYHDN